jgi:hypothetical protein
MQQCFICDKEIEDAGHESCLAGAGSFRLSFGYGSRFDSGSPYLRVNPTRIEQLLSCDEIEGYLCDDCFEKNQHKLQGFKIRKHIRRIKVIET